MILDRLFNVRSTFANPSEWLYEALTGGEGPTISGQRVSPNKALSLSVYFAAIRAIAEDMAKLPFILYERLAVRGKKRRPDHSVYTLIHDAPNPETSAMPFWETMLHHAMGWGNGIAEIERTVGGMPVAMWQLDPTLMQIYRADNDGRIYYEIRFRDDRAPRVLSQDDVFHLHGIGFDGLTGYSIAQKARESIGSALAARKHGAALFGNASRPGGVLSFPGPVKDKAAARKAWEDVFGGEGGWHRTAIIDQDGKYTPISVPNKDAQWIEAQNFSVEEIARWFRMPPHKLQHLVYGTYSNVEHLGIEYVVDTLTSWSKRMRQEVWRKLIPLRERETLFAEHVFEELLRGDTKTRYEAHAIARQWGWRSANDVLELENENPLPGKQGDIYMVPANMMSAKQMLEKPKELEAPVTVEPTDEEPDEEAEKERFRCVVQAHLPALCDAYARILRVEQDKIRRKLRHDGFANWYATFRTKHIHDSQAKLVAPLHTLLLSANGLAEDADRMTAVRTHAARMAERHVRHITDRPRLRIDNVDECARFEVEREVPGLIDWLRRCGDTDNAIPK